MTRSRSASALVLASPVLLAALVASLPAHALYKVVGPDGKVTYTDRPPTEVENKVLPVGVGGAVAVDTSNLPYELRQTAQRYPVTLYVSPDCRPCEASRQFLKERGVPYTERSVVSNDDNAALQRIAGTTSVPALTVGAQVVRGWERGEWSSYLDAAGYPKTSQLPTGYQAPAAAPLTAPKEVVQAPAAPPVRRRAAPASAPAETAPTSPPGFKF